MRRWLVRFQRQALRGQEASRRVTVPAPDPCSTSIVVMLQPSKLMSGVRFPGGAPSVASMSGYAPDSYSGEHGFNSLATYAGVVERQTRHPQKLVDRKVRAGSSPAARTQCRIV